MEDHGLGLAPIKAEGEQAFEFYTGAPRKTGWWAELRRRLRRAYWALRGDTGY